MVQHKVIPTNGKSYMVYRTAPFSMTLNDLYPQYQGHGILWRSQKRYNIQTQFQWHRPTNKDLHILTPYSTLIIIIIIIFIRSWQTATNYKNKL